MRKILRGAVVLLIAIAMVFSTVAIADTQTKETTIELNTINSGTCNGARDDIVWDNGMDYDGLGSAQYDSEYPFEAECADDFHFEEDTEVCDVHWIGGYWAGDPAEFDWEIIFYYDDGSGTKPGNIFAGPFTYQWADINIEDLGNQYYLMWVYLPENIWFYACEKFWISIQGVGVFPPQSGWGYHYDPVALHQAVFKSEFFGFPEWTDWELVNPDDPYPRDMCFQLTTKGTCEPAIDVEKEVWDEKNGRWVDADTQNEAFDVAKCTNIQFKITVTNTGDCPLYNVKVHDMMHTSLEYISADPPAHEEWLEGEWYNLVWYIEEMDQTQTEVFYVNAHVKGDECTYDVNRVVVDGVCYHGVPVADQDECWIHSLGGSREFSSPLLNFLQSHPNLFPLLQLLLQRLGLY